MPWEYRPPISLATSEERFANFRNAVAERTQHLNRLGWKPLASDEDTKLEKQLRSRYPFDWQSQPPAHCRSWDVAAIAASDEEYLSLESELNLRILDAIRECTTQSETVFAIDWQHTWFRFKPHEMQTDGNPYDWAVAILPELNVNFFTPEDFRFGVFATPETNIILIYGKSLLDAVATNPPTFLSVPVLEY